MSECCRRRCPMAYRCRMITVALLAHAAACWGGAAGTGGESAKQERGKQELAKLQGVWKVTALTYNGKDYLADGMSGFEFAIKGDEAVVQGNDKVKKEYARLRLKLEPEVMPKFLELTITGGVQKDAKLEGIYELKDRDFKLCVRVFGVDRRA